ncbi:Capsular polysaccharide synthesis enzyme Cap5F [hydrothermal vent metagenome]|uniref:Capsular polysaccharide synthesis enzyme Cap5F n=1 Tax=hydrothermal vent metagenome TaxID=652676 RepID=A0A3B1B5M7_9ZZZZ
MRVLITGADGFIGKNLVVHLDEMEDVDVVKFSRENSISQLASMCSEVDFVIHLAGINRPENDDEFTAGNEGLTNILCDALSMTGRKIPVIYSSSIQADRNNPYGRSKLYSEQTISAYSVSTGSKSYIYRLPNVFGKWCKPNYNSVIATFCHNIANDLEIQISDPNVSLDLVYIDDVVKEFVSVVTKSKQSEKIEVSPVYSIKLGELAEQIRGFRDNRKHFNIDRVGMGLTRCLYATYLSYQKPENFSYDLIQNSDKRGSFVEILKTVDSGQFSYFTSRPGETRGEHYHHTKNEKFLVVSGKAKFQFRNIITNENYTLHTSDEKPQIIETIPGWAHDITNIGQSEMVVFLWANEIFDKENPDTYRYKIE